MKLLHEVSVAARPAAGLEPVTGAGRYARLISGAAGFRDWLGQRTVWNVNSTAAGGGVAEMLQVLVGYATGLDLRVRWVVIGGDPGFFPITKRLHNPSRASTGRSAR
jgi:trehalose synthase